MASENVIFIGNRAKVLEKIITLKYDVVNILCVKESYLQTYLEKNNVEYHLIRDKLQSIKEICKTDFDLLISNGFPFILPISKIKKKDQKFINIHPSLLPDLKGKNPVNGAFLYNRDAGATCHYMDDGIDTGDIISQVKIPLTEDLNLGLLYQLSFIAEADVFEMAHDKKFLPDNENKCNSRVEKEFKYYTRNDHDLEISLNENIEDIIRKIKAFGIEGQGAYFNYRTKKFKVMEAQIVTNEFLLNRKNNFMENQVVCMYSNNLLIKKGDSFLHLKGIVGDLKLIYENCVLT